MILDGKRLLVTGVVNHRSIAFSIAERAMQEGAEVVLTSFGRVKRMTERAVKRLPTTPDVLELDVNNDDDFPALAAELERRWQRLDGAVHAIAFAPEDALGGEFMRTPRESAKVAFETSAFSFKALSGSLLPLLARGGRDGAGGSVVGLDFDASVAWPIYDWMGVSKAALEAVTRYVARDVGAEGVRANLISAGPVATVAAGGIPGFQGLADFWGTQAPLGWDTADPTPVADAALFLLSDFSRGITGEIIHVDGGYHAMGAPTIPEQPPAAEPDAAVE